MKRRCILISLALINQLACGGEITGTVHAESKAGADNGAAAGGAYASLKYKFAERVDYSAMRDFVVYIDGLTLTNTAPAASTLEVTTMKFAQHSTVFSPHIVPVLAVSKVALPNDGDLFLYVFS